MLAVTLGTAAYWALPRQSRMPIVAAGALICLAWFAPASAVFCLTLTLLSYALIQGTRRTWLTYGSALAMFVALLLFRELLAEQTKGAPEYSVVPWLGAAFFTLRVLHCMLVNTLPLQPVPRFSDYCTYLFFPPTLLLGPVQRYMDFEREVRRCRFDPQLFSAGLERILFGYFKVVFMANYLVGAKLESLLYAMEPGFMRSYLECLEYGLALYFTFAGYSDIAIGVGLLLGIRLPENFHHPFFAKNISDFWRRWHASVSSWCRDHVSFPIYARTRSAGLSALLAMVVLGLWHECSLRYLLWGAYHGCGILVWQRWQMLSRSIEWQGSPLAHRIGQLLSIVLTFNFVVLGFAITREPNINSLVLTIRKLFEA